MGCEGIINAPNSTAAAASDTDSTTDTRDRPTTTTTERVELSQSKFIMTYMLKLKGGRSCVSLASGHQYLE